MKGMFSEFELSVLNRFRVGRVVTDRDEAVIKRYAAIGFFSSGFNWDTMEETARLTPLGLAHL